jgi:regulator of protease activity HflC (stomatin/prohibitin superfamily)
MIAAYLMRNPLATVLLLALVLVGGGTGAGWWLAARDRDAARVDLVAERERSSQYRDAIAEQNRAVAALAEQKAAADARGQAAQQLAAANGKRFDMVLAATRATHALNCADAMPVVDAVRDAVR